MITIPNFTDQEIDSLEDYSPQMEDWTDDEIDYIYSQSQWIGGNPYLGMGYGPDLPDLQGPLLPQPPFWTFLNEIPIELFWEDGSPIPEDDLNQRNPNWKDELDHYLKNDPNFF